MNASQIIVDNSLERLRYFFGQLLTQRDLEAEQAFHLALRRLAQRETFGTGTIAGLRVTPEHDSVVPPRSVFVLPGLAMDPDGRELLLEEVVCLLVADEPLPVEPHVFSPVPGSKSALAAAVAARFGAAFTVANLDEVVTTLFQRGLMPEADKNAYFNSADISVIKTFIELIAPSTPVLTPPTTLQDWIVDQLVGVTYVGARYAEHGADPAPAVLDAACCGGTQCFASRAQEGVELAISSSPFPDVIDPFVGLRDCLDSDPALLCGCLLDAWRGLPASASPCVQEGAIVPLAIVYWARFDSSPASQVLAADNCALRPLAPGGPSLRALAGAPVTATRLAGAQADHTFVPVCIRLPLTAATPGSPDDVPIFDGNAPYPFTVLDSFWVTSTAIGGATVQIRSASGGGGSAGSSPMSAASASLKARDTDTDMLAVAEGGSLFLRRSNAGVAGTLVVYLMKT